MKLVIAEPLEISRQQLNTYLSMEAFSGMIKSVFDHKATSPEELQERIHDADILVIANTPLPASILEHSPNLKMISVAFTGVNHIDLDYCRNKGITACNAAGYSTQAVAELTIGLMIDALRNITWFDSVIRKGQDRGCILGKELSSKTVGIIGTGAIGVRVIDMLLAFRCRILAYSRTPRTIRGVEYVSFNQLLNESDIISLHLPLSKATENLFGEAQFSMMKTGAYFINTARGGLVSSVALAHALNTGKLAGAAVDVYETEPPLALEHPLLKANNLVTLPHIGYATEEAINQRASIVFKNITGFLSGHPQNIVS